MCLYLSPLSIIISNSIHVPAKGIILYFYSWVIFHCLHIQLLHHLKPRNCLSTTTSFFFSYELKCEQGTDEPTLTKRTTNKTPEEVDIRAIGQRKQCSWPFPWRELPISRDRTELLSCFKIPTNLQTQMSTETTKSIKVSELSWWGLPKSGEQSPYLKEQP